MQPIEIDGSQLEGGGQILRISSALSVIFKIPIHVFKIRAGRQTGGLSAQHLKGLELLQQISRGQLTGNQKGSSEITFHPGSIRGGSFHCDVKTAGSVCLLMQSILPCCLFGRKSCSFTLIGGTNAAFSPPIDHTTQVLKKICEKIGIHFDVTLKRRGFYPQGQGEVSMKVNPIVGGIRPFSFIDQGHMVSISGLSFVAGYPIHMANAMAEAAEQNLKQFFGDSTAINIERRSYDHRQAFKDGASIILWAETSTGCVLGSSGLFDKKKNCSAEGLGLNAAEDLIKDWMSGSCVDRHTQDQLVIFMALAKGTSKVRTSELTLHTETAIKIVETLTKVKFSVNKDPSTKTVIMECEGVGTEPDCD